jgi:signal transduction histidine kinase
VDVLPGLSVPLILLAMSLFMASFLRLKQKIPKMFQVFRLVQLFAVFAIAMVLVGQNHRVAPYVQIIGFLQIMLILPTCVLSGLRGYRPGYIAAIAFTGWILGASLVVLRNIGLLNPSWATTYGFQIGNVLEVILLALALADRINIIKKERELAQAQLLRQSQNASQELEAQVKLRTAELGQAVNSLEQLNNEKNEFLGIAAHDLKNPLTAIIGMSELLRNAGLHLSEPQRSHYLERISKNGQRMMRMITNLLDVNAMESGHTHLATEVVDLNQRLRDMALQYEDSASAKGLRLQLTVGEQVLVMADGDAVSQVLDNLISNAVKYSPHGKNIWLSTSADQTFGYCRIQDEGEGLSEADQQHLFERFARLSTVPTGGEHSSGLGLSIVKKLTEAMHGSIMCESAPGRGSTFTVSFPLAKSS